MNDSPYMSSDSAAIANEAMTPPPPDTSNLQSYRDAADILGGNTDSAAPSPDTSGMPTNSRTGVSNPVQAAAPAHHSIMSDILHAIGSVLGGPSTVQTVNPQTGAIEDKPLSRAGRIANTAGIYLRGAAAGAAQHGPAAAGKAALAGAQEQQGFQQQQQENTLAQSKNVQEQLRNQAGIALLNQQIAESGFRMAREGTEVDDATAQKFNAMQGLLSSDDRNTYIGHFDSFKDMLSAHPELTKAGFSIPQLQAKGLLRAIVTTKDGKSTGVDVYKINPQWLDQKNEDDITLTYPSLDAKGNRTNTTKVIPANSISHRDALQLIGASNQRELDSQEAAIRLQNQTKQTTAEVGHLNAETNLADQQARQLINAQQADPFGNTPTLPQKELLKRQDSFQKDTVNKAYDVEKAYNMSQQAYAEYQSAAKQGKQLPTGAQSMLLLSQHLGTTFGNVKGSRITKDMISEHLGARGLTDDAVTAVQRIVNGDQLSPAQWKAFTDLIGQSRNATWENAISSAKNQQLPITFLPRGNGRTAIDSNTAQLYLDAAGGDWQKATAAAQKQGWQVQ